ncbi:MAG TPA: sugar phosphate isomerase/epimerase family protein [Phycisphaerales bacterium]|nr:sugar phosphate isomerase/epimerase family protein [Phycisphaerales bacterium]
MTPPPLGVCSWSLRPADPADLATKVRACGLDAVQLALDPIRRGDWDEAETGRTLRDAGIAVVSGMMGMKGEDYSTLETIRRTGGVRPDETWPDNLAAAEANAALAQRLGIDLVTFHAGFLPHDSADPERERMLDRLRTLAEVFGSIGVRIALETGQETADTLIAVLDDLNAGPDAPPAPVGVNFDPANMILYGMGDPITAFTRLSRHVAQVHLKDARPTQRPGTWGTETPLGDGAVRWPDFFYVYRDADLRCDLVIERESGEQRVEEVRSAAEYVRPLLQ